MGSGPFLKMPTPHHHPLSSASELTIALVSGPTGCVAIVAQGCTDTMKMLCFAHSCTDLQAMARVSNSTAGIRTSLHLAEQHSVRMASGSILTPET